MPENQVKYKVGQFVIYANGSRLELGEIKEIVDDVHCRVWYHTGDTSALTHVRNLTPIKNDYAFTITRLRADVSYKQCTICNRRFEGHGHNPEPIKSEGVCCDSCNRYLVVPHRLSNYKEQRRK